MIFYNGATGGLGSYLGPALARRQLTGVAIAARLEDTGGLEQELDRHAPEIAGRDSPVVWIQLAARVSVPACEAEPAAAFKTNVTDVLASVRRFAQWAHAHSCRPHLLYVSSGHVYAELPAGQRASESHPVRPRSVYATSKLRAEEELAALARTGACTLIIARVFGLLAPRQPSNYLLPGLIRRVRQRDLAGIPGLDYARDYLDARDVCEHLLALAPRALAGEEGQGMERRELEVETINVCSGQPITPRALIERVIGMAAPDERDALLSRLSAAPGRADDVPWIVGDPAQLSRRVGEPQLRPIDETIADALSIGTDAASVGPAR
jgi:nucleoside-diphosphate-sugar epimerase